MRTKSVVALAAVVAIAACTAGGDDGGPISVSVFEEGPGTPAANAFVLRHSSDGSLLEVVMASADGTASVAHAGMISAGWVEGGMHHWVETWIQPDGGDSLILGMPIDFLSTAGTVTASFASGFPAATRYSMSDGWRSRSAVVTTAGSAPPPIVHSVRVRSFAPDETIDLVAVAVSPSSGGLAFATVTDVSFASGPPSVSFPAWSTAWATQSVTTVNGPPDVFWGVSASPRTHGLGFSSSNARTIGGAETVDVRLVPPSAISADSIGTGIGTSDTLDTGVQVNTSITRFRPTIGAETFDLATALPMFTSLSLDLADPERPTVRWSIPSQSGVDAVVISLFWYDDTSEYGGWRIHAPSSLTGEIRLPELPSQMSAWRPFVHTGTEIQLQVTVLESTEWNGYDGYRRDLRTAPPATEAEMRSSRVFDFVNP